MQWKHALRSVLGLAAMLITLAAPVALAAQLRLPGLLSDHALLQRDRPIHIWGWGTAGQAIRVGFHTQQASTTVDQLGQWSLYLAPERAGGPYSLSVMSGGETLTVADVLVGDLWVASGQSNMEFPLKGFGPDTPLKNQAAEIAAATHPELRLLIVDHKSSDFPLDDQPGHWLLCTPATAQNFSAVAYFFGRDIATNEHVPQGLIDATWGGTPADSWVSMETLGTDARLLPAFASRARFADQQAELTATIAEETREDAKARAAGKPAPSHQWHPYETSWLPAGLYDGMIAPLTPMTVRGILWYQGETNSGPERAPFYGSLFESLIGDWRMHFKQGMLPFLYVQISSFNSPGENWGLIRDWQRRTLNLAGTAMAVSLDIGNANNVHPADKQTVGSRLALAARAMVYGEQVSFRGPLLREATTDGMGMRAWFDDAEGLSSHGQPVTGFELAGADHRFFAADAEVQGTSVLVRTASVPHPKYMRFGWGSVVMNSLYNTAGLPMATFSSETAYWLQNPTR